MEYNDIDFKVYDDCDDCDDVDFYFIGFDIFKEFLEDNGVLDRFIENFYNVDEEWKMSNWSGYSNKLDKYTIRDYLENTRIENYFIKSFRWMYYDWPDLNGKWMRLISIGMGIY
jgi:hypothetical protein